MFFASLAFSACFSPSCIYFVELCTVLVSISEPFTDFCSSVIMKACINDVFCFQVENFFHRVLGSESSANAVFTNGRVRLSWFLIIS